MLDLLKSDTYVEPGTYIRRSVDKDKLEAINRIQFPVVLGVGSRFLESQEVITRGYIYDELVSVSELYPNTFSTKFAFIPNQKKIKVYENDSQLPTTSWSIVDSHTIQLKEFNPDASYSISYPSNDRSVRDKLSLDVVNFDAVGDFIGADDYEYGVDYYLEYFFTNIDVNKESQEDALQFYPLYANSYDYPIIKSLNGSYLEIDVSNVENNIDINGYVLRVDRGNVNSEDAINFIWLDFTYTIDGLNTLPSNFKIVNDNKYHYWKGIGFKIVSDDIVGKELTKKGVFIEESENPNQFSLSVCAPKKLVKGPNRTVSAKIVHKGEIVKNGTISNIVTECDENFYYIGATNPTSKSSKFHLRTEDYFLREGSLYLVFVYSDDFDNKQYKEVECTLYNNTIELHDYSAEFEINGVHTTIYGSDIQALSTESDIGIMTEEDLLLLIDSDTSIFTKYKEDLISFDYTRGTTDNPTVVEVSNTFSRETERVEIDSDIDFYSFNGILARLNYDFDEGDTVEFDVKQTGYICWDLTEITEEAEPYICTDVTGEITGEYCAKYVQLRKEYLGGLEVISNDVFEYSVITKDNVSYLVLSKNGLPYVPRSLALKYRSYTKEPDSNKQYYVYAKCTRPDSMYNTLIEVTSLDEGRQLLGPFDNSNDLFKANEIAWREFSAPMSYGYVQIKDSDNDGVISEEDVRAAFEALIRNKRGTDIVLLDSRYQKYLVDFNNVENDPFEQNENKIWLDSVDIDYAQDLSYSEYAEFKNVTATGRAMLELAWENQNAKLVVSPSFVTWAIACVRNSIEYSETILNRTIKSFSEIEVFNEKDNRKFGENNLIYVTKKDNDYVISEDSSLTFLEQVSNQKVIATRYVRQQMDSNVGKVIDLPSDTLTGIQTSLIGVLNSMINKGYISSYLDDKGNKRPIDAKKDIFVTGVKNNPTHYQFGYGFYTKKGIKHLFGSYVVDRNFL